MAKIFFLISIFVGLMAFDAAAHGSFQTVILKTSQDDLEITFIGHGSLMFTYNGKVIHVDPFSRLTEYSYFCSVQDSVSILLHSFSSSRRFTF